MSVLIKLALTVTLLWFALLPVAVWLIWHRDGRYFDKFAGIWLGLIGVAGLLAGCELLMGLWCL